MSTRGKGKAPLLQVILPFFYFVCEPRVAVLSCGGAADSQDPINEGEGLPLMCTQESGPDFQVEARENKGKQDVKVNM